MLREAIGLRVSASFYDALRCWPNLLYDWLPEKYQQWRHQRNTEHRHLQLECMHEKEVLWEENSGLGAFSRSAFKLTFETIGGKKLCGLRPWSKLEIRFFYFYFSGPLYCCLIHRCWAFKMYTYPSPLLKIPFHLANSCLSPLYHYKFSTSFLNWNAKMKDKASRDWVGCRGLCFFYSFKGH